MRYATAVAILTTTLATFANATSPTGWSPVVVPTGPYRSEVRSQPITQRPGRLLHVYGNSVRMVHQSRQGTRSRPVRQIVFGTSSLRSEIRRPR